MGLIGLGNMGAAVAERLLDAGYELVVHNRSPRRPSARGAGRDRRRDAGRARGAVDVVLTSLADDEALEAVAADVVAAARPGTVLVDTEHRLARGLGARRRARRGGVGPRISARRSAATRRSCAPAT